MHESVESLLISKSNDGPVTTHPFKVIDSEVDRRSLNSDSRSIHGRQVSLQRIVSNESIQPKTGKVTEVLFFTVPLYLLRNFHKQINF